MTLWKLHYRSRKPSDGLRTCNVIGWFLHFCLRLRQYSFNWLKFSVKVTRGIGRKWNRSSSSDSVQLTTLLSTLILDFGSEALLRLRLRLWLRRQWKPALSAFFTSMYIISMPLTKLRINENIISLQSIKSIKYKMNIKCFSDDKTSKQTKRISS